MKKTNIKKAKIERRHKRIRSRIFGTAEMPRLCVFRSNTNIYAQIIDDNAQKTLVAFSSDKADGKTFMAKSIAVGKEIAKLAKSKNIEKVVFDRGGFLYTGKVKALADGAREGGLKF
jgi:large subunit ribosomal protein L18